MFDELPAPSGRRLAARVTPDALRQVRGGSPWVYDRSITSAHADATAGELAVIFDSDRRFAAIGLWDPSSPIRIKVLHVGKPVQIDREFWHARLRAALQRRQPLVDDPDTTAYRWVNGEGDGLPGLVLDRYDDQVVLKLYTPAWWPHLTAVVAAIDEVARPSRMVLRMSRAVAADRTYGLAEGDALIGTASDDPVRFVEHGLQFQADLVHGQKTGHFLDQRENRQLLRSMIERLGSQPEVLDMFASTGGFSVYAASGGAGAVTSVDISAPTLHAAEVNMALNRHLPAVAACTHEAVVGDAYEVMERLQRARRQFDMVVIDPPSFAQRQDSIERGLTAYGQLTQRACALLRPGGLLVQASCSSRITAERFFATVRASAQRSGFDLTELRRTGHALDHPIAAPEGEYLKCLFATVGPLPG
jgi:23S rRNA (cytosine1962-C5)-methyltransferase